MPAVPFPALCPPRLDRPALQPHDHREFLHPGASIGPFGQPERWLCRVQRQGWGQGRGAAPSCSSTSKMPMSLQQKCLVCLGTVQPGAAPAPARSPTLQSVTAAGARQLCNMYLMSGLSSDIIPPCWHIADLCISDACNPPELGVRGFLIWGCQGRVF